MNGYRQLFLFVIWSVAVAATAQSVEDVQWTSAQDAYLKGDYKTAATLFEKILAESPVSASIMYNLGNCYLQDGDLGKAVLWYERALKLRPRDQDVLHNLSIAEARRTNPVVDIQEFFAMRWIRAISGMGTLTAWAVVSLFFFWAGVFICAWSIRSGKWSGQRWVAVAFGIGFILSLWMGFQRAFELRRSDVAIVMKEEVSVSIAPDSQSKLVAKISAGEKVMILDSLGSFFKVRLTNYEHGWIPVDGIEKI